MKRRFIAGAVCPACSALDRIVLEEDEGGGRVRACVACGFREALAEPPVDRATGGRFDRPPPAEPDSAPAPVKIIDPKSRRS